MRWTSQGPEVGNTRTKFRFLFLPKTIGGETRWLEWAKWTEEFRTVRRRCAHPMPGPPRYFTGPEWRPVEWVVDVPWLR